MRALILTAFSVHDVGSLQLADEQIIAGPDWPDCQTIDGCWRSLRTPAGEYNLPDMLAKIPAAQKPDVLVCFMGAGHRSGPGGIASFPGRKLLLVADTPDFGATVRPEIPFKAEEAYDRVVFLSELNVPCARQPGCVD